MTIGDVDALKRNCAEYAQTNKKSIEVLRNANGKNHYTKIAKIVGIHPTKVSGLLKKAEKWGLARKVSLGIYKRYPILGYMPKPKEAGESSSRTSSDLIEKIRKASGGKSKAIIPGVVIPNNIFANIDKMTAAYAALYAVENSLRALIRKVFGSDPDWWKKYVPSDIQNKVTETMNNTPYHAASRKDELEYAHLGQLKEIIISKKNWNAFLPYLKEKDKNVFGITINRAIPSRNAVGHCITLKAEDLKVIDVRFGDILKMI